MDIATQNLLQWKTAEVRGNKPFHGLLRFKIKGGNAKGIPPFFQNQRDFTLFS